MRGIDADKRPCYVKNRVLKLVLFFYHSGAERAYGKFIFAYSVEGPPHMSNQDGTVIETLFWALFTAGRGVSVIISKFCPPLIMLIVDLILNVAATAIMTILADKHSAALWFSNCLFGAVLSPLFPSCLAWANFYIKMSAKITALAFTAAAVGSFGFSWLSGYLFEYKGPSSLMYLMLGYAVTALSVFMVTFLVAKRKGQRDMHSSGMEDDQGKEEVEAAEKLKEAEEKV